MQKSDFFCHAWNLKLKVSSCSSFINVDRSVYCSLCCICSIQFLHSFGIPGLRVKPETARIFERCDGLPHGWAYGQVPWPPVHGVEPHRSQGRTTCCQVSHFCSQQKRQALQHSKEFGSSAAGKLEQLATSQAEHGKQKHGLTLMVSYF